MTEPVAAFNGLNAQGFARPGARPATLGSPVDWSAAELDQLSSALQIVESALDLLRELAQPEASEQRVWAHVLAHLLRQSADAYPQLGWGSGARPVVGTRAPHGELHRGYLLLVEPAVSIQGQQVRVHQPLAVQDCDRAIRSLSPWQTDLWEMCCGGLRPGEPLSAAAAACQELAVASVPEGLPFDRPSVRVTVRSCGPVAEAWEATVEGTPPKADDAPPSVALAAGSAFELSVLLQVRLGQRIYAVDWSDVVLLEPAGARCLGHRQPGLWVPGQRPRSAVVG